jgi:hypothetical protein
MLTEAETATLESLSERARSDFQTIADKVRLCRYAWSINREEIDLCKEWLELYCCPRATINYRWGCAYNAKHSVERWTDKHKPKHHYISEFSFLAAALELGYQAKVRAHQMYFNIAQTVKI